MSSRLVDAAVLQGSALRRLCSFSRSRCAATTTIPTSPCQVGNCSKSTQCCCNVGSAVFAFELCFIRLRLSSSNLSICLEGPISCKMVPESTPQRRSDSKLDLLHPEGLVRPEERPSKNLDPTEYREKEVVRAATGDGATSVTA